ncbi:MAG: A/G-specific adenine glycosylase [Buchnera aphidicola (Eriosoma harunire)]
MIFSQLILNWFHDHGRKNLPWKNKNLYEIWISEIMLQQTKVKTVIPYYNKFIQYFPNITILGNSSLDQIMNIWSGMGYYHRAKNIHKTAKIIIKKYNGCFPDTYHHIINLPGIGKTTAGAILSFSLGYYFPILDSNVKRILSRIYLIHGNMSNTSTIKILWNIIERLTPIYHTDKFNQAIMDVGSLICTINNPKCNHCPLNKSCLSYKHALWHQYPKKNKKEKKIKKYLFGIIIQYNNSFLLNKINQQYLWNELFTFPIFETQKMLFFWIKKNELDTKNMLYLPIFKCNVTTFQLILNNILIKISSKPIIKDILPNHIWYNFQKPQYIIGIPTPIKTILKKIINCNHIYE